MFGKILIPTAIQVAAATLTVKVVGTLWELGSKAIQRPQDGNDNGGNNNQD